MANSTDQALFRYVHHTFASDGTSLHPSQRTGDVSANGARSWWGRDVSHQYGLVRYAACPRGHQSLSPDGAAGRLAA